MWNVVRAFRSKFAVKLWSAMMLMICFSTVTVWVVQIFFIEPSYVHASARRVVKAAEQYVKKSEEIKPDEADELLSRLSMLIGGMAILGDGKHERPITGYSIGMHGYPEKPDNWEIEEGEYIKADFRRVLEGEEIRRVLSTGDGGLVLVIGIPVRYLGEPAALVLSTWLSELRTVQSVNRRQLIALSVITMLGASLVAVMLMDYFSKPIRSLRTTVNRLAGGDLTAVPDVRRPDELGQLADSVKELGVALRRVDVLRKEVIANVSHELKAPLSVIIGYSEMVRDISWRDDAERTANLNLIIAESERLGRIVDDILDYSQLQAGYIKLNRTPCNLYEAVEREVGFGRQVAQGYDITIELSSWSLDIPASLDEIKMTQVLRNLLNNAINHTKDGESVRVTISRDDGASRVSVINPGPIIPEEARELIWERYQRIQHQGSRREGSGIGLSIVGKVLSVHGFDYGVDSNAGCNEFWFRVPDES